MKKILFVCTGNTCRSPMAEALFRHRIGSNIDWIAASAGLCASTGSPATAYSITALKELGIALENHRSQPVTQKLVRDADLIVVMTGGHQYHLLHEFPKVKDKVYLLKSFGTSNIASDVADPFGGSLSIYKKTCDEIDRAISDLILFIHTGKL